MGALHVRAWQAAYREVMPGSYLDGLRAKDRADLHRRAIAGDGPVRLLVADLDGTVAGFVAFGPSSEAGVAELYALNVDPDRWSRGVGRALLRAATAALAAEGFADAVLWVAPSNQRARYLYESEGWVADGVDRDEDVGGVTVAEVRYHRRF